ncbi:hypothetical protein ABL_10174 [Aspergillus niger]|uniref:Uncharacterized protein n=1 Tax=Aspergillus niger TaxID=5061 RepID=A0A117E3R4_ASPNG|nr:hypothetical protein ABL_10174 [Aspergillus niger]
MRSSIESSSDLIHQKEDQECDNSDKSDDLLDSTLSTLSADYVFFVRAKAGSGRQATVQGLLTALSFCW